MIRLLTYKLSFIENELNILNIGLGRVDSCIAFVPRSKYNLSGGMNNG